MSSPVRAALLVLAAQCASPSLAAAQERPLQPGDEAPAFTLPGTDGRAHSLSEHIGARPVVVAWFPKAFATL